MMSIDALVDRALRQKKYFGTNGGVTISGGEATLHRETLLVLFKALHAHGIHTCLDTNGLVYDEALEALYAETDLVLMDIKHIDDVAHKRLTSVSNEKPLKTAAYRESTGKPMWLRYVLVPGWSDDPAHLEAWAQHFSSYKTVERVEILPYHKLGMNKWAELGMEYKLHGVDTPTQASRQLAKEIFSRHLNNVVLK